MEYSGSDPTMRSGPAIGDSQPEGCRAGPMPDSLERPVHARYLQGMAADREAQHQCQLRDATFAGFCHARRTCVSFIRLQTAQVGWSTHRHRRFAAGGWARRPALRHRPNLALLPVAPPRRSIAHWRSGACIGVPLRHLSGARSRLYTHGDAQLRHERPRRIRTLGKGVDLAPWTVDNGAAAALLVRLHTHGGTVLDEEWSRTGRSGHGHAARPA